MCIRGCIARRAQPRYLVDTLFFLRSIWQVRLRMWMCSTLPQPTQPSQFFCVCDYGHIVFLFRRPSGRYGCRQACEYLSSWRYDRLPHYFTLWRSSASGLLHSFFLALRRSGGIVCSLDGEDSCLGWWADVGSVLWATWELTSLAERESEWSC